MELDSNELNTALERLKNGQPLDDAQLARYLDALKSCSETSKRYTLLHIGGLSGDRRFREALEASLSDTSDPMLARIGLLGLCRYWGESFRYVPYLKAFAAGVPWDDLDDVRLVALELAGEYLRNSDDDELLRTVIDATDASNPWVGEAAYAGLASMSEPGLIRAMFDADEKQRLLDAARDRLEHFTDH